MNKSRKILVTLLAALLAAAPAASLISTSETHVLAAAENKQQGKLGLNHTSYIYNKKGQRLQSYRNKKPLIKKNKLVRYAGRVQTIADPNTKRFSFRDYNWNGYYLPYKTIKGKEYYNIGHGGYIKAINVSYIDGFYTQINEITITLPARASICDRNGNETARFLKKGQKVTLDRQASIDDLLTTDRDEGSNATPGFYGIKNHPDEYLEEDYVKIGHILPPYSSYMQVVPNKVMYLYNIDGTKQIGNDQIGINGEPLKIKQTNLLFGVTKKVKIWDPKMQAFNYYYVVKDPQRLSVNVPTLVKVQDVKYVYGVKI